MRLKERTYAFGVTQAALEPIQGEKSLVELARIYNVHPNTVTPMRRMGSWYGGTGSLPSLRGRGA